MHTALQDMADRYIQCGIDLAYCGDCFKDAGRLLSEGRLERAETAIRSGLDRLSSAVEAIPRSEIETGAGVV